jgi:ribosomal protein S18 acetylase RimI-like enzyme
MRTTEEGLHQAYSIERLNASTPPELFQQLANLHVNSIHGGILEALGPNFLASLYQQLSKHNEVLMYAARRDSTTIGFVAGSVNVIRSLKNIGFIGMVKLAAATSANAWRPSLLKKALQTVRYFFHRTGDSVSDLAGAEAADPARSELLAIAVAEEARGQGVGRSLVTGLEQGLQNQGGRSGYFVSTNEDEIGSNAFYRAAGFTLVGQKRHHDLMLNVYKKEFEQWRN